MDSELVMTFDQVVLLCLVLLEKLKGKKKRF